MKEFSQEGASILTLVQSEQKQWKALRQEKEGELAWW